MSEQDIEGEGVESLAQKIENVKWREALLERRLAEARARREELERRLASLVKAPPAPESDPVSPSILAPTEGGEIVPEVFSLDG